MENKLWLQLVKKILNNNGYYFYRDIKIVWGSKFTAEELEILKSALAVKECRGETPVPFNRRLNK